MIAGHKAEAKVTDNASPGSGDSQKGLGGGVEKFEKCRAGDVEIAKLPRPTS